jgi:serine/threonine protein kinase
MNQLRQNIKALQLMPGHRLGGYEVTRLIGEGNFGIVSEVSDEASSLPFALKLLKLWSVPDYARQNLENRFRLEYETGRIDSNHLVKTWNYGHWEGCPYLVMDYCPNGNLRHQIRWGVAIEKAAQWASDILLGLQALHQHGKTHRDLKPENILLDSSQRARLTDFGIAGHLNARFTVLKSSGSPGEIFGSYNYMAPEQIKPLTRRDTLLPTIDLFAFGVVCFELFTGRLPFGEWAVEDDMGPYLERATLGQWDKLQALNPDVPEHWIEIVEGCLAPDPRYRFQQVAEILDRLGTAPSQNTQMPTGLQVLDGEEHGRIYQLDASHGALLQMGRAVPGSQNQIAVQEHYSAWISRQHATLERHQHKWFIRDGQWQEKSGKWEKSKNGTFVNGLEAGPWGLPLHTGDIITIGNTTLKAIAF